MDVNRSIKILELVCCDEFNKLSINDQNKYINEFYNINKENKPIKYRNLTKEELRELFLILNKRLKQEIKQQLSIHSDFQIIKSEDNNRKGADAYFFYTDENLKKQKVNLEMKFGSETLANIGQEKMDEIFKHNEKQFSFKFLNNLIKNYQRDLIDKGIIDEDELINNLKAILIDISDKLNGIDLKPEKEKINQLIKSTGDRSDIFFKTIKYEIYPKKIKLKQILNAIDDWKLENISVPNDSARIQIILKNGRTKLKFLLNWKNNYEYPKRSGRKYSAKTGGTTSSWNVWLYIDD